MRSESGFSLVELLIVVVIIGILATLSVQYLTASRRAANGASAVESMRVISSAQESYAAGVGNRDFGTPQDLFFEEYIDESLSAACVPAPTGTSRGGRVAAAAGPKSGYVFNFTVAAPGSVPMTYAAYGIPAVTSGLPRTGDRAFYIDQTGVIRFSPDPTQLPDISSLPLNN